MTIVAVASTLYGIDQLSPPSNTRGGQAQYIDRTFEEQVEVAGIIIEGTITDVGVKIFTVESIEVDENGNEVVFETIQDPRAEITIKIKEVMKDNYGLDSKTIIVYDLDVPNAIGKINGEKTRFISKDAYDYQVGEKGIFLIQNDRGLWINGFTSFYPIEDGKTHTTTGLNKLIGKSPIDITKAKDTAKKLDWKLVYDEERTNRIEPVMSTVRIPLGAVIDGHEMLIPKVITVVLGKNNTVTWINEDDTVHGITSDKGGQDAWGIPGILKPGESYSITFDKSGIFPYHGEPHPWMTGTVIVLEE